MKTLFYILLYKNTQVIYAGVTTRSLNQRFNEHIKQKRLNKKDYSIKKIDEIIHPNILNFNDYIKEKEKVTKLETHYIKEYGKKFNLLNISKGGEWGSYIYNLLSKENFLKNYGSLDGYKEYILRKNKLKCWLNNWISHRSLSIIEEWLTNWHLNKNRNKTKQWLMNWYYSKTSNYTKNWLFHWISHKSMNKTKIWLNKWCRKENSFKVWLQDWIYVKNRSDVKAWLSNWISNRTERKIKRWLKNWIKYKGR